MKSNATVRIILWSVVIVLLLGILGIGLSGPVKRMSRSEPATTEVPVILDEASAAEATYPAVIDFTGPWTELSPTCDETATVIPDGLNVRSAPTSSSPIVGMVEKGDIVKIDRGVQMGKDGNQLWLGIYSPMEGWIKAEFVDSYEGVVFVSNPDMRSWSPSTPSEPVGDTMTASSIVTIRSAPDPDSSALGQINPGDSVTVTRREHINGAEWAYITQPSAGWILTANLTAEDSSPAISGQENAFDPRQIREIEIEWAAGAIIIEPAEVDDILVTEAAVNGSRDPMLCRQNGDELLIRYSEKNALDFNWGITINDVEEKHLVIQVPIGWECDSLEISAASATVDVKNLAIHEVDFDGASGTCSFENCVIGELDIDTASGDIHFSGTLDVLDCDAASASVYAVCDNVPRSIDMDSVSGDLVLTLPENAGFTVSMDVLANDFLTDFGFSERKDGTCYRGDGKCKINMDALSGNLYIWKFQEAGAAPEATAPEAPTAP